MCLEASTNANVQLINEKSAWTAFWIKLLLPLLSPTKIIRQEKKKYKSFRKFHLSQKREFQRLQQLFKLHSLPLNFSKVPSFRCQVNLKGFIYSPHPLSFLSFLQCTCNTREKPPAEYSEKKAKTAKETRRQSRAVRICLKIFLISVNTILSNSYYTTFTKLRKFTILEVLQHCGWNKQKQSWKFMLKSSLFILNLSVERRCNSDADLWHAKWKAKE